MDLLAIFDYDDITLVNEARKSQVGSLDQR